MRLGCSRNSSWSPILHSFSPVATTNFRFFTLSLSPPRTPTGLRQPRESIGPRPANGLPCRRHPDSAPSETRPGHRPARGVVSSVRVTGCEVPGVAADKMDEDGKSIKKSLAAQDPIVRELLQDEVEHGVLIPLKTTLELRDDYQTGRVLITRAPTKAANPVILYVWPDPARKPPLASQASLANACIVCPVCYAVCYLMKSLRVSLISADAPSRRTCRRI